MKKNIAFIIFATLLISCGTTSTNIQFNGDLSQTGIYESDENGKLHVVLDNQNKTYLLKTKPSIGHKEFINLEIDKECYGNEVCVNFGLTLKGTDDYTSLTKRNLNKQIFFVIDGVVISDPNVMGIIDGGMGQFTLKKKYLDSLFIIK